MQLSSISILHPYLNKNSIKKFNSCHNPGQFASSK